MYVIRNENNDQLFWSDELGWVEFGEDFFTQAERYSLNLPFNGIWVYCPEYVN